MYWQDEDGIRVRCIWKQSANTLTISILQLFYNPTYLDPSPSLEP
jgi:hypothetical protein